VCGRPFHVQMRPPGRECRKSASTTPIRPHRVYLGRAMIEPARYGVQSPPRRRKAGRWRDWAITTRAFGGALSVGDGRRRRDTRVASRSCYGDIVALDAGLRSASWIVCGRTLHVQMRPPGRECGESVRQICQCIPRDRLRGSARQCTALAPRAARVHAIHTIGWVECIRRNTHR
jgi:hypothetical protein